MRGLHLLLLACVVGTALCEHQKRDVHKIIIKERVPRHHKRSHSSTSHSNSHSKSKKNKKSHKKPISSEEDDSSSEEKSSSEEESIEQIIKEQKGRESIFQHSGHFGRPAYISTFDFAESKPVLIKENPPAFAHSNWVPLNHDHLFHGSYEFPRDTHRKKKQSGGNKKHTKDKFRHPTFAGTTYLPSIYSQVELSTLYPPLDQYHNTFHNNNENQKPIELNQSTHVGTIEQPKLEFPTEQQRYDVKEESLDTPTIILVPEANPSQQEIQKSQDQFKEDFLVPPPSTTIGPQKRGRNVFRGRSRF